MNRKMGYSLLILRIKQPMIIKTIFRIHKNSTGEFIVGYRYNGDKCLTKEVQINGTVSGTKYHNLRIVIDNTSEKSAMVFLDNHYFGSFQEHFVSRLKGGVFVLNRFRGVALFKNFTINGCKHFNKYGRCLDNDGIK